MKPMLLDLYCGGGGAGVGYARAGFRVVGVDKDPQPHYPMEFAQADALDFLTDLIASGEIGKFAVIHASPPCQRWSQISNVHGVSKQHPDLIEPTRDLLQQAGLPYIIENVPAAPLINPIMLCGTMFGLTILRHRIFETKPALWWPPAVCRHGGGASGTKSIRKRGGCYKFLTVVGHSYKVDDGRRAMGIDWLPRSRLSQAIPPAYTEWIGLEFMRILYGTRP